MSKRITALTAVITLTLAAVIATGCAAPASEDESSTSEAAVTGSLAQEQARSIRAAYAAATLESFTAVAYDDVPRSPANVLEGTITPAAASVTAELSVPGMGSVFLIEQRMQTSVYGPDGGREQTDFATWFFDARGRPCAVRMPNDVWLLPVVNGSGRLTNLLNVVD